MGNAGSGPGLQRTRRDGIDADALRAQFGGQVAHRCFQRRLHGSHQAIIGDDFLGAQVTHGHQAAAVRHQGFGQLRHAHEGVAGDIHRLREAVSRTVRHAAMQVLFGRVSDGMDHEIEPPPLLRDLRKQRFELARHGHVEWRHDGRLHLLRQRFHMRTGLVIEPGDCQFGTGCAQCAGAAPGDALRVGDTDHQPPLALQRQVLLQGGRHA